MKYLTGTLRNIMAMTLFLKGYRTYYNPCCIQSIYSSTSMTRRCSTLVVDQTKSISTRSYDLEGLQNEVIRQKSRTYKKIMKHNDRLQSAQPIADSDTNATEGLKLLQERLSDLKHLEESLKPLKSCEENSFSLLIPLINKLNIVDTPPARPERIVKPKVKPVVSPRKPYNIFRSYDDIELFVGRRAEDNDELSCNSKYRDNRDWWLHVADHAGSHVVIRSQDNDLPKKFKETVLDAAVLAIVNSKAKDAGKVTVHLTRCGNVSKPRGAKPGLVHITGDIRAVVVNMKIESRRLERLKKVDCTVDDELQE